MHDTQRIELVQQKTQIYRLNGAIWATRDSTLDLETEMIHASN